MQNQFCLSKQLSYDAAKLSCKNVFIRSVTLIPCGDSLNTLDVRLVIHDDRNSCGH